MDIGRQSYLKPGEFCLRTKPGQIITILGSCVALTFFDPSSRVGAICHAVHPYCQHMATCREYCGHCFVYVACAIPAMIEQLRFYGIDQKRMELKLFGGASLLNSRAPQSRYISVGRQNTEAAFAILQDRGLPLKVAEVGGGIGRKLIFDTASGNVWVKRLIGIQSPIAWQGLLKTVPKPL